MALSVDSHEWEKFKTVIRTLYIAKRHTLEGPDGVIKLMENRHAFKATKAQYEKQFKEWGFQKKRTKEDWKIMSQKIGVRKRTAKESDVYLDGQLVAKKKLRKEISRQGYMTAIEQFNLAHETTPQTPPGFEIRTPIAMPLFRLIFENLPILQFQENLQPFRVTESMKSFDASLSALAPLLDKSHQINNIDRILPIINSLLPNSAFLEEVCASGLAIERVEKLGSVEFLNLATFLISNNFPGEANSEHMCNWLKNHANSSFLKVLSSTKGPTTDALLEKCFRFAIEAEDIPTVKYLINAGVNPNGHACRHPRIPENLTPLQLACIRGNTELAQELIKAGSRIDQPGAGWKSSALVLAIIGESLRSDKYFWDKRDKSHFWGYGYKHTPCQNCQDDIISQGQIRLFLNLINSLIDAGAAINPKNTDILMVSEWQGDKAPLLDERLASVMRHDQSPLTVASKYRHKELVDLLIQKGADVEYLSDRGASALHECLYSCEEMELDCWNFEELRLLCDREVFFCGSEILTRVICVVRILLDAGAGANQSLCNADFFSDHFYEKHYGGCTALDLSVLTGSLELMEMMVSAGACPTSVHSVEHAIQIGDLEMINFLLKVGAPISTRAVSGVMQKDDSDLYVKALHFKRHDIQTKAAILEEAIRFGKSSVIEYLLKDGTDLRQLFHKCSNLTTAIENCCSNGHLDTLRLILDKNSIHKFSISPWFGESIHMAVSHDHHEVVDALLFAGANVNKLSKHYKTALFTAVRRENRRIIRNLIMAGAVLNPETNCCSSCNRRHKVSGDVLVAAIEWGDSTMVKDLVEAGASMEALGNIRHQCYDECSCITPLTAAIMKRDSNLVNYLIWAGAAFNSPPNGVGGDMTPLSAAIQNRDFEMVNTLLQGGANPYDALALKEATNDFRLLQVLLSALSDCDKLNYTEDMGLDALNKAIEKHDQVMVKAILDSPLRDIKSTSSLSLVLYTALLHDSGPNLEIIRMLLRSGADPNTGWKFHDGIDRKSALVVAIEDSNLQKVELLLETGAQADRGLTCGMELSPMQLAVSLGNQSIVQKLLHYGSDPNAVSLLAHQRVRTPLQLAADKKDVEMVRILLRHNGNPNVVLSDEEHTALQVASRDGIKEMVEILLEHGADVNAPPAKKFGATALQFAAIQGRLGIAYLLLESGADVNAPSAETGGRTALEGAAENGRIDMVQLLLNSGANIFQDGQSQYESAARRASENGHHATRRLLESYHG